MKTRVGFERRGRKAIIIIVIETSQENLRTLMKCFKNIDELRKYIERKIIKKIKECI